MLEVYSTCTYMWVWDYINFHMFGKWYTFRSFFPLNSTHIISQASNLISTFVLMLIVIFLSFVDWQHGWGVLCTCEYEIKFHMFGKSNGTLFVAFFPVNSTHIISKASNLISTFIWHIPEFRWLVTWLRCILYMWVWDIKINVHTL